MADAARTLLDEDAWDEPPEERDFIQSMDQAIMASVLRSHLNPWSQVTLSGDTFELHRAEQSADHDAEFRATHTSPLEAMYSYAKRPLEEFQYLAGCRFRVDWHLSRLSPLGAIDYAQAATYAVDDVLKAKGAIEGPKLSKVLRTVRNPSDSKLDAIKRLGDLFNHIGGVSYYLADKVIGEERSVTQIARVMGKNERYMNERFRECLDDLAGHYKLCAR